MKLVIILLIFLSLPISVFAQSNDFSIYEVSNTLERLNSSLNENTLVEIINLLVTNQSQTPYTQLSNTILQITGVFIAIIGGFFTTKLLSIATERKKIQRKINEINSELKYQEDIIMANHENADSILQSWAQEDVEKFRNDLLSQSNLKEYSKNELINMYESSKKNSSNDFEKEIIYEQYDEIIANIKSTLQRRKDMPDFAPEFLFSGNWLKPLNFIPRNYKQYSDIINKIDSQEFKFQYLKEQKHLFENEKLDLSNPVNINKGFVYLFFATCVGIIYPISFQLFLLSPLLFPVQLFKNFSYIFPMNSLFGFLFSYLIMMFYFGVEIKPIKLFWINRNKN